MHGLAVYEHLPVQVSSERMSKKKPSRHTSDARDLIGPDKAHKEGSH